MNKTTQILTIKIKTTVFVFALIAVFAPLAAFGQFDKAEFIARRAKFFEKIADGAAVVIGNEDHPHAVKFRQAPDFYYLTGIEEPNSILLMLGRSKQAIVFAPRRSMTKVMIEGPGLFENPKPAETYGVAQVLPLEQFQTFFNQEVKNEKKLYAPLTPPEPPPVLRTTTKSVLPSPFISTSADAARPASICPRGSDDE